MRISRFHHLILSIVLPIIFTSAAWCARADKGGSSYGQNTAPCPATSGPQSPTAFGALTATCFGPGSGVGAATLFEIKSNTSPFPSTFSVLVNFSLPSTIDYGLITCDGNGTIPCTNKSSALGAVNPVDFAGSPTFNPSSALFSFSNFKGDLEFYVNEAATITTISASGGSATPEPQNTAAAGLFLLCTFGLIRRFTAKREF
jgi:hypothetical protein